ncbi:MAG: hypothetical protein JWM38_573 [Sphingomonas bacterium]|nr:hypothetical protein [Sphingomonas bacterium]
MGDVRNEPSMEDILASIKRIIAEDGAVALNPARFRPPPKTRSQPQADPAPPHADAPPEPAEASIGNDQDAASDDEDAVLELTDPVADPPPVLVSDHAAIASRHSLAALSAMVIKPESEGSSGNTLEALVREMLRPMLKDWLDARLPELVEGLVAREIARITGKPL